MIPRVSVIIPCLNERDTIGLLLEALLSQTYPPGFIEVVIADGLSSDGTREVVRAFQTRNPSLNVTIVDNPERIIPAGLNRAIAVSRGEVILRLDAHSIPSETYIQRCVETLERTGAANVGGQWDIQPAVNRPVARAIAAAASHPLGAGDARYRISGEAGPVETVPFGAFRRAWLDQVGLFDERLLANEDYEFNVRLHQAGGLVWFDPEIRSIYFARPSLRQLGRQYLRYGYWKAQMLKRYPRTLRWRQAIPPAFVLATWIIGLAGIIWQPARALLAVQWGGYLAAITLFGCYEAVRRRDGAMVLGFPAALGVMHLAWGCAFLWSMMISSGRGQDELR